MILGYTGIAWPGDFNSLAERNRDGSVLPRLSSFRHTPSLTLFPIGLPNRHSGGTKDLYTRIPISSEASGIQCIQ